MRFPEINRALWRSASRQAHLAATAAIGHRYPVAVIDAPGFVLLALPLAGSLYIMTGLARRLATAGLRWSTGHPARPTLLALAACPAPRASAASGRCTASSAAGSRLPDGGRRRLRRGGWRDGYLGWARLPPSNRMTSAFM